MEAIIAKIMGAVKFLMVNWPAILAAGLAVVAAGAKAMFALAAVFMGLGALFLLIPGPHPEDWFFKIASVFDKGGKWVEKFSKK